MFSDKDLRKLIVPLVIEQILAVLVGTADTVMVSYAGESAISGVSLVDMFAYMVITILTALATGGAVIVSQYLGNKEQENANRAAGQLMVGTLLASGVVCVICAALNSQILHLLYGSAEESVLQAAETYMFITAFSFPFLGIYNSSAALFRSMKKTNMTMYVSLLMNVINIAGNAIGIFVLKAGVAGVAVPTLLSRAVAGIVMTALAFNAKHEVYLKAKNVFCRNFEMLRRILKIAIPNAIENRSLCAGACAGDKHRCHVRHGADCRKRRGGQRGPHRHYRRQRHEPCDRDGRGAVRGCKPLRRSGTLPEKDDESIVDCNGCSDGSRVAVPADDFKLFCSLRGDVSLRVYPRDAA